MNAADMPKAVLHRGDGTKEEIDDLSAYFFYLRRVAQRMLKQLKDTDELDDVDIGHVITAMERVVSEKADSRQR